MAYFAQVVRYPGNKANTNWMEGQSRKISALRQRTIFPRIHRHAVIYETAYFQKWTGGFVYIGMPNVIRGLRHAVISEIHAEISEALK